MSDVKRLGNIGRREINGDDLAFTLARSADVLIEGSGSLQYAAGELLAVDEEVEVGAERAGLGEQLELAGDLFRQLLGDLGRSLFELLGQLEAGEGEISQVRLRGALEERIDFLCVQTGMPAQNIQRFLAK